MPIITNDCVACGQCVEYCPANAIEPKEKTTGYSQYTINKEKCVECLACLEIDCSGNAIKEK